MRVYKRRAFGYNPGMSETDAAPPPKKKGMNCGMWLVLGVLWVQGVGLTLPLNRAAERASSLQAAIKAREIMVALKIFAGDHNGRYPDDDPSNPKTSNDAFRLLFVAQVLEDERIFGSPLSPFVGDHDIGEAPDFKETLESGENHWCMTKGLTDSSDGSLALVFENPVDDNTWPPVWNADEANKPVIGRAWEGGKTIVARNDGSVMPENLISTQGPRVPLTDEVNAALFPPGGSFLPVAK